MDECRVVTHRSPENRCDEPADCVRSLATKDRLDTGLVENPRQPRHDDQHAAAASHHVLEHGDSADAAEPQHQRPTAISHVDVGSLGGSESAKVVSVSEKEHTLLRLRPSELTRLLNSTPLGTVISERQLYRYRERAGNQIGEQRRIDLFKFTAWLVCERHQSATDHLTRRRAAVKHQRITKREVLDLLESQSYCCALTGWELTPHTASLDHQIPVSRGGEHSISNAQALHEDVNRAKGTLTNEEFVTLCRAVVRHADNISSQSQKESQ